jgi:hypothetical protein
MVLHYSGSLPEMDLWITNVLQDLGRKNDIKAGCWRIHMAIRGQ